MSATLTRCHAEQSRCEAFMSANGDDGPEGERIGVLLGWLDWGAEVKMIELENAERE